MSAGDCAVTGGRAFDVKGGAVGLYSIRPAAAQTGDGWEPLLLAENFQKPK